ncbi:hypothetical protein ETB97_012047 [Aspergillus alliaceus]|uniref:Uncharacterized protein n=1 Tax=Petromyces alliaceus TaxID=209559 RepID=A0A8H6A7U8_PETAA|nr:hypothetical protein ETB97_012047 [Aspergillus burnettii]
MAASATRNHIITVPVTLAVLGDPTLLCGTSASIENVGGGGIFLGQITFGEMQHATTVLRLYNLEMDLTIRQSFEFPPAKPVALLKTYHSHVYDGVIMAVVDNVIARFSKLPKSGEEWGLPLTLG